MKETVLQNFIINKMTQEQYDEALKFGSVKDDELYLTDLVASDIPSASYDNLTFNLGTSYEAPADGWIILEVNCNGNSFLDLRVYPKADELYYGETKYWKEDNVSSILRSTLPIKKGGTYVADGILNGNVQCFRFLYAK